VERCRLQQRLTTYILKVGVLYRRSFGQEVLLRCVSRKEANQILLEMHKGVSGKHQSRAKMYHNIKFVGYYWPQIMADCNKIAKSCHNYQIHDNFKHLPPVPLHPTVSSCPFNAWGIDVIGAIEPPSARGTILSLPPWTIFLNGLKLYH
jgi:hypothetical protein